MKYILNWVFGIVSLASFGQVVPLEHSYTTAQYSLGEAYWTFVTASGFKHYTFDYEAHSFTIFDDQHQFYKTVNLPLVENDIYKCIATDKLFNSDPLIEFLLTIRTGNVDIIILVNEDGVLLQNFGNRFFSKIFKYGNDYKLVLSDQSYPLQNVDVYRLPGSTDEQNLVEKGTFMFPNPSNSTITIVNALNDGENGRVEIFNLNGEKLFERNVTGTSTGLIVDVSNLSSGVYIYKINGKSKKFIKN